MRSKEIEQILDKYESENNKESEYDDIPSGEREVLTHESDAHEMLR